MFGGRRKSQEDGAGGKGKEEPLTLTVDEALERVELGRGQYFGMTVNLLLSVSDGMQLMAMFYLPMALKHDWGTAPDTVAWLDAGLILGTAIGVVAGGIAADTYGRKPAILVGAFLSLAAGVCCAWAGNFTELLTMRTLVGIALGFNEPACMTITLETCPPKYRGKASIAVQGVGGAAGKIFVAVMADALYDPAYNPDFVRFGWRTFLFMCAVPALPALILGLYVTSESARWLVVNGRAEEGSQLLRRVALRNGTAHKFPEGTRIKEVEKEESTQDMTALERMGKEPLFTASVLTTGATVFTSFVYFGLLYALPVYIEGYGKKHGWDREQKNLALLIVALSEAPAIMVAYATIDWVHVGRRMTVIFALAGTSISCFVFNFQLLAQIFHSSHAVIVTNFFARGFAAGGVFGLRLYVAEIFPTHTRGAAIAVTHACGRVGAAVSPVVVAFLLVDWVQGDYGMWTKFQPMRAFLLFAIFAAVGAYMIWELGLETEGQALPDTSKDSVNRVLAGSEFGGRLKRFLSNDPEQDPLLGSPVARDSPRADSLASPGPRTRASPRRRASQETGQSPKG
mmetsp:Transcript_51949/g.126718  ORF Transcript_51949/g.126718 Transcript_51949/m.126718 type:complete len:570 (+) Transcript_51949:156-1865(+)